LSFSQPIALRVNELISGVNSDLAVKIFGADLDVLKKTADRAAAILGGVRGAGDVKVEQISGMNEVVVEVDREAIARYGINASEVNEMLEAGLAGRVVGTFVEEQRRFAVLVRLSEKSR
jgi:cobalt-zinc-cadmium resistance protein CzcA